MNWCKSHTAGIPWYSRRCLILIHCPWLALSLISERVQQRDSRRDLEGGSICHQKTVVHPGATRFFSPADHCALSIAISISSSSFHVSLAPRWAENLFLSLFWLLLLRLGKTESSCKPFGGKISLSLNVTALQQHRGPFQELSASACKVWSGPWNTSELTNKQKSGVFNVCTASEEFLRGFILASY